MSILAAETLSVGASLATAIDSIIIQKHCAPPGNCMMVHIKHAKYININGPKLLKNT